VINPQRRRGSVRLAPGRQRTSPFLNDSQTPRSGNVYSDRGMPDQLLARPVSGGARGPTETISLHGRLSCLNVVIPEADDAFRQ
jgi:hypothetical protein